jgi:hypothetical protein
LIWPIYHARPTLDNSQMTNVKGKGNTHTKVVKMIHGAKTTNVPPVDINVLTFFSASLKVHVSSGILEYRSISHALGKVESAGKGKGSMREGESLNVPRGMERGARPKCPIRSVAVISPVEDRDNNEVEVREISCDQKTISLMTIS